MRGQPGFFDIEDRLTRLSDLGDQLEAFAKVVDFEMFRPELEAALDYSDRAKGGRPPFDPVLMFKILLIQAHNNLSDDRAEFLINDRLSFMRFLGLGLADKAPDAKTIWLFRERLTKAGAIEALFTRFDQAVRAAGHIPMAGQIVDASLVAAPKQRNSDGEKRDIKEGRIPQAWAEHPATATRAGRWSSERRTSGPTAPATPTSRSRSLATRTTSRSTGGTASSAASMSPMRLHTTVQCCAKDCSTRATPLRPCGPTAPTARRRTRAFMAAHGFKSQVHRRKPKGRPMAPHIRRGNATRSAVRAAIEPVFAHQKGAMALTIRTIGLVRAKAKIGLANLTYNIRRLVLHERRAGLA